LQDISQTGVVIARKFDNLFDGSFIDFKIVILEQRVLSSPENSIICLMAVSSISK